MFINYFETRNRESPDYVAAHALAIEAEVFRKSGGFPEPFLPLLEDVELSHRLRRDGCRLVLDPEILVRHIFNFSLGRSLRNAARKSRYWTLYSLRTGDLFADSGTASRELKVNVATCFLLLAAAAASAVFPSPWLWYPLSPLLAVNVYLNRGLFRAFLDTRGLRFTLAAALYYLFVYPLAIGAGALAGLASYLIVRRPGWEGAP